MYKKLLRRIAHYEVTHPVAIVAVIAAITIIMLGGATQVKTVAALENMMPGDLEEIAAFRELRDAGLGQDMIAIVIETDMESPIKRDDILSYDVYEHVQRVSTELAGQQDILAVNSLTTALPSLTRAEFEALDPAQVEEYVNDARTNTLIIATTDVSANDERMQLLVRGVKERLDGLGRPPGVQHKLTGTPIIQQELGELIGRDRRVTQLISTIFVLTIVMLIFGTFTSAIVPIILVTLSVTWLYGTMGYVGLPISTLAGGVAAMVIGIGIDYAIHLMNRFKYERKQGMEVPEAIEAAVADTGLATSAASLTTILAFVAFLTGAMPEMHRFGILMTLGVGYSALLTLVALPAMLVLEERIFFALRKHLHFGIEGEYFLATQDEVRPPGYEPVSQREHARVCRHLKGEYMVYKRRPRSGGGKR